MAAYLLVNKQTNIVDNAVEWDGNTATWQPPETHIAIPYAGTPSIDWVWNETTQDWDSVETIGNGGIGDTWDGTKMIETKPNNPQETP